MSPEFNDSHSPAECACGPLFRHEKEVFGSQHILALLQSHNKPGGLTGQLTAPSTALFDARMDMEKEFLEHVGVCAHLNGAVAAVQTTAHKKTSRKLVLQ